MSPPALICESSYISTAVQIGEGSIIHPKSHIEGNVILGENCIVEEFVFIKAPSKDILTIGQGTHFEAGCVIHAAAIGQNNLFENKCIVKEGTIVGNDCIVGAGCMTSQNQVLGDGTVIWGSNSETITRENTNYMDRRDLHYKHHGYLIENLPKYHHIRK